MPVRTSLSTKILLGVLMGTVIIFAALSMAAFSFTTKVLQQAIMDSQLETARQTMNKIDRLLNERILNIQTIAGAPPMENFLIPGNSELGDFRKIASKRINEFTFVTGPWDLLMMADKEGKIVLSSSEKEIGKSVKEQSQNKIAFEAVMREEFYYSDLVVSENTSELTVIFAAPIRNRKAPKQPVIGAVIGHFAWPAVLQVLEDVSNHVLLVNKEGALIGQNMGHNEDLFTKTAPPRIQDDLKSGRSESVILQKEESMSGSKSLTSFAFQTGYLSYQGNGWGLLLEQPIRIVFEPARMTSMKLVGLLVPIVLAGVLLMMLMIVQWILRPIAALTRVTHEIAAGDLNKQAPADAQDEMGQLAASFNTMTEKLRKAHENLEAQVRERTQELSKTVEDLTSEMKKRKTLENAILQSEKMAAIGQLAGGVAHEINNPLGVILGFAQNVAKRINPGDPFELPLKSIEREAVRCKNLVQDLLTFSRLGKGEKEFMDLRESIESALALVQAQSKVKNVDLVKEISEVPKIVANKNQIQQIIINLSNNAIDAMPNGGRLIIGVKKTTDNSRDGVEIRVQDTGQGIPESIRAQIFNPFFTTKEIGKGTGLGLSLVYEIVQKHSGQILLDSEIGKGTTFRILLPLG